ncbi:MAG: 50S ribosomal protein L24, partial [Pyrinomonadaceae bacterium]|nr:50S ribosomal protein L24 [Pyrinomonadaceae bacterium]
VKVEGAMIVKKHQKADPRRNVEGGILKREAWVDISNVAIADPKSGAPTRIGFEIRDGKKVRIAKASGEIIPEPGRIVKEKKEESVEKAAKAKTEEKPEAKAEPKKPKEDKETKAAEGKKDGEDQKVEKD